MKFIEWNWRNPYKEEKLTGAHRSLQMNTPFKLPKGKWIYVADDWYPDRKNLRVMG